MNLKELLEILEYRQRDEETSPAHYRHGQFECIELIKDFIDDHFEVALIFNVLKYLYRYKDNDGVTDLKKARNYLNWLIEYEETGDIVLG